MKPAILFFTLFLFFPASPLWAMEPEAGVIKNITGNATIGRGEQTLPAAEGVKIHTKDILETSAKGSMGIIFRDDSTLSMGPETRIVIDDFMFSPGTGKLSFVTKISKGTAAYLSGKIGKLSPGATRVETPLAVLGIRGTRFLVEVE
ncbi:MAG: FecR domain-containing protein [Deltaproteobacteria bacterium]|nr:FecR domain-containing protein [Deltaproteobacteria bacterium]